MSRIDVASVDGWMRACSAAFVPLRVRSASARFTASLAQTALTRDVTLTRVVSGASEVFRDRRTIAENPRDDVLLSLHRSGTGSVEQHGRRVQLHAGSAVLYEASAPYVLAFPAQMTELVLQIPRRALKGHGHGIEHLTARPLPATGSLRALTSLAGSVDPRVPRRSAAEDEAIADALAGLLASVVAADGADAEPAIDSALLLRSLLRYCDEHLLDSRLSPETLAHTHHISLRLVQKLFAREDDSPAAYIRRGRLRHAHALLRAGALVGVAAQRSGFEDVDTFTRAFKREFGVTPSGIRPPRMP